MTTESTALSPHETKILVAMKDGSEFDVDAIAQASGLKIDQARSATESLKARGLVEQTVEISTHEVSLTDVGRKYVREGLPEKRILDKLGSGELSIAEAQTIPGHDSKAIGTAFGYLKQNGFISVEAGRVRAGSNKKTPFDVSTFGYLQKLFETIATHPQSWETFCDKEFRERYAPPKRGSADWPISLRETSTRKYRILSSGHTALRHTSVSAVDAPAALTKEMLKSGEWKKVLETTGFRPYNVAAPAVPVVGRRDPYREFLDGVKKTLIGLGFEEMTGNLVETEFWDMDALYLPQFHPAREIHDVYFVENAKADGYRYQSRVDEDEAKAIENVAREHEGKGKSGSRGWGYEFDRERTKRCVLRSQGTVLSARWLSKKDLKNPGKYFAMARCFRYDTVDATHAPDFFQVEGIVVSEKTSFRHLLGLLKLFALEVARAPEVKFVPAYFPFTEPSVEVHMKHPTLGWMELGGAGIFRPEVTLPHGITSPVIAWGLGLDRMAMVALGIKDIRELFTNNVPNGLSAVRERIGR